MNRYKVIFDTDPGIDDAVALLLLHAMPSVDLQGITTVFGNASIEDCTRNALYICAVSYTHLTLPTIYSV